MIHPANCTQKQTAQKPKLANLLLKVLSFLMNQMNHLPNQTQKTNTVGKTVPNLYITQKYALFPLVDIYLMGRSRVGLLWL